MFVLLMYGTVGRSEYETATNECIYARNNYSTTLESNCNITKKVFCRFAYFHYQMGPTLLIAWFPRPTMTMRKGPRVSAGPDSSGSEPRLSGSDKGLLSPSHGSLEAQTGQKRRSN